MCGGECVCVCLCVYMTFYICPNLVYIVFILYISIGFEITLSNLNKPKEMWYEAVCVCVSWRDNVCVCVCEILFIFVKREINDNGKWKELFPIK